MKNIAILCSGGDVSGMNAALKRFVEYAIEKDLVPYFVQDGYEGLIDNHIIRADYHNVVGIIPRGGTQIGSSRSMRFMEQEYRQKAIENLKSKKISSLVILGGDGSFKGMEKIVQESKGAVIFSGIPSTIDNDIADTDYCLGVDTALNVIKNAIDSIRDTASSFNRAFVIETMGNTCGYLALVSALTSGAEMCLIPEIKYNLKNYKKHFTNEKKKGRGYFIAIVCEALKNSQEIAQWFEKEIGIECRATVLGHIQRGGNPTVFDRLMAVRFVTCAIDGLLDGITDSVVCYKNRVFEHKKVEEVTSKKYYINEELLKLGLEFERKI